MSSPGGETFQTKKKKKKKKRETRVYSNEYLLIRGIRRKIGRGYFSESMHRSARDVSS